MMRKAPIAAGFLVVLGVLLFMSFACSSPRPPRVSTPFRTTVEGAEVELYLQGVRAQETLEAVRAAQTATAAAGRATATAVALRATEMARYAQATATARAWEATATVMAFQATARAEAWQQAATATYVAWQQAATATRAAWEVRATSTAVAAAAAATAQAARAEEARLEAERARMVYPVRAYGPWALLAVSVALLVWAARLITLAILARVQAIPRDAQGDAPLFVFPKPGGGIVVIDPDRSLGPALVVGRDGVSQPQLAEPDRQERVTARDQTIGLARTLPGRRPPRPISSLLNQALPGQAPAVRVVPPEDVRPWLDEVGPKALEEADGGDAD